MKKIICVLLVLAMALTMVACNKQIFDVTYEFDRAIIELPNGEIIEGEITSWRDFEGDQIQVKINGKTYLVHSSDIVMIAE